MAPALGARLRRVLDALARVVARVVEQRPRVVLEDGVAAPRPVAHGDERVGHERRAARAVVERAVSPKPPSREKKGPKVACSSSALHGAVRAAEPPSADGGGGASAAREAEQRLGQPLHRERVLARRVPRARRRGEALRERAEVHLVLEAERAEHDVAHRPVLGLEPPHRPHARARRRDRVVHEEPGRLAAARVAVELDDRHAHGHVHVQRAELLLERPHAARDELVDDRALAAVRRERQQRPQRCSRPRAPTRPPRRRPPRPRRRGCAAPAPPPPSPAYLAAAAAVSASSGGLAVRGGSRTARGARAPRRARTPQQPLAWGMIVSSSWAPTQSQETRARIHPGRFRILAGRPARAPPLVDPPLCRLASRRRLCSRSTRRPLRATSRSRQRARGSRTASARRRRAPEANRPTICSAGFRAVAPRTRPTSRPRARCARPTGARASRRAARAPAPAAREPPPRARAAAAAPLVRRVLAPPTGSGRARSRRRGPSRRRATRREGGASPAVDARAVDARAGARAVARRGRRDWRARGAVGRGPRRSHVRRGGARAGAAPRAADRRLVATPHSLASPARCGATGARRREGDRRACAFLRTGEARLARPILARSNARARRRARENVRARASRADAASAHHGRARSKPKDALISIAAAGAPPKSQGAAGRAAKAERKAARREPPWKPAVRGLHLEAVAAVAAVLRAEDREQLVFRGRGASRASRPRRRADAARAPAAAGDPSSHGERDEVAVVGRACARSRAPAAPPASAPGARTSRELGRGGAAAASSRAPRGSASSAAASGAPAAARPRTRRGRERARERARGARRERGARARARASARARGREGARRRQAARRLDSRPRLRRSRSAAALASTARARRAAGRARRRRARSAAGAVRPRRANPRACEKERRERASA